MKKLLLAAAILVIAAPRSSAQFITSVSVLSQTYTPLTGATNLSGALMWDEESYQVPFGFTFKMNGNSITNMSLVGGQLTTLDTTLANPLTGFSMVGADLWDRGGAGGTVAVSPIRYQVTGTAPNRIFKVEVANAGFFDEYDIYGTNNDFLNYQIWFFETTNVFEIHYGPSLVSHPTDYFFGTGKPFVGYFKNLDFNSITVDMLYYLDGNPASPTLDSTNALLSLTGGLTSYPANGTVYRFSPKSTGISNSPALNAVRVFPTECRDEIIVGNTEARNISYRIVSVSGAVGSSGELVPGDNHIALTDLPAGVYMLQLQSGSLLKNVKFTKL